MTVLYYAGLFLCDGITTFAQQKYGRSLNRRTDILIYSLITGVISMLFFWISSGFSVVLNLRTIFYALILTATSLVSYFAQLLVYRHMGVAEVGVITMCGKLLFTSVLGIFLFSERVTPISIARTALMLIAMLLIFIHKKKKTDSDSSKGVRTVTSVGLLLCILIVSIGVISTITSKYIAVDPEVTNSDSLFFFTNAMIAVFSIFFIFLENRAHIGKCAAVFRSLSGKQYLTVVTKSAAGSAASLLGILILATSDVSLYSPLSNALGLLAAEAVAVFTLREPPLILPLIPAVLSMLLAFFG